MAKSVIANTRHTVGDVDGGKSSAITESTFANTRHLTGSVHKGHFLGDYYVTRVFIRIGIVFTTTESNYQLSTIISVIVINGFVCGYLYPRCRSL